MENRAYASYARLDDTDSLEPCLAIDLVVAWRVYWMTMVGREKPDTPCDQILSKEEWHVLSAWATGKIPATAPNSQQAMRWIGKMGGWLARGQQDNPGTTCMWRGLGPLPTMAQGYLLALRVHGVCAGPGFFENALVSKKIELPKNWDKLVAKYKDLKPNYEKY